MGREDGINSNVSKEQIPAPTNQKPEEVFGSSANAIQSPEEYEMRGVKVDKRFSNEAKKDVEDVLGWYESILGSLDDLKIRMWLLERSEKLARTEEERSKLPHRGTKLNPLTGYHTRAEVCLSSTSPVRGCEWVVLTAPKEVLDAQDVWEKREGERPAGQEDMAHDFRWTVSHELAHLIFISIGFSQQSPRFESSVTKRAQGLFDTTWEKLHTEIHKQNHTEGTELKMLKGSGWEHKRPRGYATHSHYFGDVSIGSSEETFADVLAYMFTGSTYADGDDLFQKRIKMARDVVIPEFKKLLEDFRADVKSGRATEKAATS